MYNDDSILTWGKYKFTAFKRIPAKWFLGNHKSNAVKDLELLKWIEDNFERLEQRAEIEKVVPVNTIPEIICTKYQYASEEEAKRHLRQIRHKGQQSNGHLLPVRAYKCDKCLFWHLTSKP